MGSQKGQFRRDRRVGGATLIVAMMLLFVPAGASATSPVLEFVVPGHSLPVSFTAESGPVSAEMAGFKSFVHCAASHGEGEITGPRSTVSSYRLTGCVTEGSSHQKCKSEDAQQEEIKTGPIEADLVYIDQANHEVGMLLNPGRGIYMTFECGGESAEGRGAFLAPVSPVNQAATSFTATLSQSGSAQTPNEYENENGEKLKAIPTGKRGSHEWVTTGVQAAFTVDPNVPVEIKAINAGEIEAKQHEEEAQTNAAAKKRQEEEAAAAAKKDQEEAAAAAAAAAKEKQEKEAHQKPKPPTRTQLLRKALHACQKQSKKRRAQCRANAHKRYGPKRKKNDGKHGRRSLEALTVRSEPVFDRE
jgi:hypothetical protein